MVSSMIRAKFDSKSCQVAPDRVPALVAGRVDAVVSQFSVFIKRAAAVEFSLPYVNANYAAMVKADSPYQKNKDLNGKVVSQRNAEETKKLILAQIPQAKVQGFKENSEAFLALRQESGGGIL